MELHYTLHIDEPNKNRIEMSCHIRNIAQNELTLRFGEKGHRFEGIDDRVIQWDVTNERGISLATERIDVDTWCISGIDSSTILWKYDIRLPNQYYGYGTSFLTDTYAHIYIPQIFMVPEPMIDGIVFVTFMLPPGWRVYTLWSKEDSHYFSGGFHRLCQGYLALGHYQYYEGAVDEAQLKIAVSNELACHPVTFFSAVEKILRCQANVFGDRVRKDLLIICQSAAGGRSWGGSPSANVIALAVPGNCTNDALAHDRYERGKSMNPLRLVNHELFHTWSIGHFSVPKKIDYWWSEGIASYYTLLTASRSHLMNEADAYQLLYDLYERSIANRYMNVLSPVEAGPKFHEIREMGELCADKGMLFAFLLDVDIRYSTKNAAGLDTLMRKLHQHPEIGSHRRGWTYEDLGGILGKFTDLELMPYIDRYIEGTEAIPFLAALRRIGLGIQEIEGEKRVEKIKGECSFASLVRNAIFG